MKHFYLLFCTLAITFGYSQNLLLNGDLESWVDATTPSDFTLFENIDQESTEVHGGTYSAKHTGGTKKLAQSISVTEGETYELSMWYKVVEADGSDARIWSYWKDATGANITDAATDDLLRGPNGAYFDNNGGAWTEYTATLVAPAGATNLNFELRTYSGAIVYWDDLSIVCTSCSGDPTLTITSPSEGEVLPLGTTSTMVEFVANNFDIGQTSAGLDGHVHGTLNGTSIPMHYSSDPIELTGLMAGDYELYLELVDNSHTPIDPAVNATVNFSIPSPTVVADLATLKSDVATNGLGGIYEISGEAVITYIVEDEQTGVDGRNQKYIQDASGAVLIDDSADVLDPTDALAEGDGLTGLLVQAGEYQGVLQLIPQAEASASSSGNTVAPTVVSIADYLADFDSFESQLLQFDMVTFADGGTVVAANTNYDFSDGTDTATSRSSFDMSSIIGATLPENPVNLVVIGSEFAGNPQLLLRNADDIILLGVEDVQFDSEDVQLANTIVIDQLTVLLQGKASIEIINTNGQLLRTQLIENVGVIPTSELSSGTYLVRIIQDNQVVVKKFIKR